MASNTFVIFSQVFIPDPASVGQHIADVAIELARRGHRVTVYASNRSYETGAVRYPSREVIQGVTVRRLPWTSFGKKSFLKRVLGTFSFHVQALLHGLFTKRPDAILLSTSPPMIGVAGSLVGFVRRAPVAYWAMDLNPDQLLTLGKIKSGGMMARFLEGGNRFILKRAGLIVALDRFMLDRLKARRGIDLSGKTRIIPPWPHEDHLEPVSHAANPFRAQHGLMDKFVIMYSGNHTPSNPLTTLLEASLAFRDDPNVRFLFVGGGIVKREIEEFAKTNQLDNIISLPYQPLAELGHSLSAADVHVVSLGESMAGIIHPCKVYGAMAVGRPILYFGPSQSHVSDLLAEHRIGWSIKHGDVTGAIAGIREALAAPQADLNQMGARASAALAAHFTQSQLCGEFCDSLVRLARHETEPCSRSLDANHSMPHAADN